MASLAAIGAFVCCILPLLLSLSLGISGAWISHLSAMQPYTLYFTATTIIFLALAFYQLYLTSASCDDDSLCSKPEVRNTQRLVFISVALLLLAMVSFPYYAQ
ncbi:MAG: mercury transporter MerT [Psychrobium sp.]|nr:mercury transporter MerT [Psychrobium sp.]